MAANKSLQSRVEKQEAMYGTYSSLLRGSNRPALSSLMNQMKRFHAEVVAVWGTVIALTADSVSSTSERDRLGRVLRLYASFVAATFDHSTAGLDAFDAQNSSPLAYARMVLKCCEWAKTDAGWVRQLRSFTDAYVVAVGDATAAVEKRAQAERECDLALKSQAAHLAQVRANLQFVKALSPVRRPPKKVTPPDVAPAAVATEPAAPPSPPGEPAAAPPTGEAPSQPSNDTATKGVISA